MDSKVMIYNEYVNNDIKFVSYEDFETVLESHGYFTEAYFGKSSTLIEAENVLASLISEMRKNPLADYTNHPLNSKLEKLLQKQFGFRGVHIVWKRTPEFAPNVMTMINSDVIFKGNSIVAIDKKKGYQDKEHQHICIIHASSTMASHLNLTPEEYLAILLHELGHNFDYSGYMILDYMMKMLNVVISACSGNMNSILGIIAQVPEIGKMVSYDFQSAVERILESVPILKRIAFSLNKFISSVSRITEIAFAPLITSMTPLYLILSPLSQFSNLTTRKVEIFADSFAAVYGYATPLASALTKMDSLNMIRGVNTEKETGLYAFVKDMAMLNRYILSFCTSDHGTTDARIKTLISTIERDIREGDYPPEVEKELKNQLKESLELYKHYVEIGDDRVKLTATTWCRKLITDMCNGNTDIIAKLFPENLA